MSLSPDNIDNGIDNTDHGIRPGEETIDVSGARVHNLKNIDIRIPKNQLVVITGIS
jgi:excinuclease ABC subunit A